MTLPDEIFSKDVLYVLKEEANHRTNISRPLGLSAWDNAFEKELNELKLDYLLTHIGNVI
jgi:hypothetical protein